MEKQMRRKERLMERDDAIKIIENCGYCVLSTISEDDTPYGVPISPVVVDKKVYFHCAKVGHKVDNINANSNICITAVGDNNFFVDHSSQASFSSSVLFGKAVEIDGFEEKAKVLVAIMDKYMPIQHDTAMDDVNRLHKATMVYRVEETYITGKAKILK